MEAEVAGQTMCVCTHPHTPSQVWEEKYVSINPDSGGTFAGFSVVGGRDQPKLPNLGAFIGNQGGPAEGQLK